MTHAISLGAGVQSTVMYLMAGHGLINPTLAFAIFADTQWEPPNVYQHLDWLREISRQMPGPIPIETVSAGDLYRNVNPPRRHFWLSGRRRRLDPDPHRGHYRHCRPN